jgi:hypothetical protein
MIEFFNWFDALPKHYFIYGFIFVLGFSFGQLIQVLKNH